ncbi:hypothetical protein [Pectobacterium parmentieri]|uniref:hypothetical protein n=1 Tax=Pectobacterium parmentieri TaxID=1905730 RepID=UPI0018DFCDCC|nr:hypothetical protein [Pectobacterium parmentieri]MBI0552592.1 hypothetical protein [Pectobacterium parmentieri]MBI0561615.1 hypothetical protein [Pectobacterium parmentieri]MBI0565901.1 hypothetical protein [Pectobacterium parmentieri]
MKESYGQAQQQPKAKDGNGLQQWAGGDPDKQAFAQAALASGQLNGDVTNKELDDNYAIAKKAQAQQQNSQTAQQLRKRNQADPPAYPPYYTGK